MFSSISFPLNKCFTNVFYSQGIVGILTCPSESVMASSTTNLFERTDLEIAKLQSILQNPTTVGQYKAHCEKILRRDTSSGGASSSSDARNEVYARAYLISLDEFELVTDRSQARWPGRIMDIELLHAYELISWHCSIPLSGVLDFIDQSGSISSSQVCGASQPTPSTHVTYTQLLTEHNMDLDVLGLSHLGSLADIFVGVEVMGGNLIDFEMRSAESRGHRPMKILKLNGEVMKVKAHVTKEETLKDYLCYGILHLEAIRVSEMPLNRSTNMKAKHLYFLVKLPKMEN
ncbi:hypothetical protein KI387_025535 [Taxus chinensis]|uniref:Uncharacterized protein n=1 Tax=Taxus chinensis TaxID=29808 RepID=A0AA38FVK6_TAXCH|nr:hypothetical protein KI387_025535 [Taxus chinensis]